jgi:hypothetical protein
MKFLENIYGIYNQGLMCPFHSLANKTLRENPRGEMQNRELGMSQVCSQDYKPQNRP